MPALLSRRSVVGVLTSLMSLIGFGGRAGAEQKVSQANAKYQDNPKGEQRCDICINFEPPNQCRFVVGPISRQGWCQFFAARENAR